MSTRERILDAAARVMRERGVAHATTKEIARAAGCSEALLYRHFDDKQGLFMAVLQERMPAFALPDDAAGTGTVEGNLVRLVGGLLDFYADSFPISASIFSSSTLLARHREAIAAHGAGPQVPHLRLQAYLEAERKAGRVRPDADVEAVARLLVGAALHHAFLVAFWGEGNAAEPGLGERLVAPVLPALLTG
ncbi:TetR/AcrR family transcriptional regulator [Promicromonospora panici]|uniref:TetR/AcrR family transcriptional regulator n=1 Tax=Promicromonospora panici TaxID=2219658 RepID=UPI00101BC218|nr:TetR/AcrR family transcriptional regulator [Promicromonospora panici]